MVGDLPWGQVGERNAVYTNEITLSDATLEYLCNIYIQMYKNV